MFYLLVLPFLLSVNSSTSIRAFIQGSLSSSEQQLNLSQLLERQHSPTHLLPAQCRQRVRAGASRIGFCPGCLVKGTWHGLERQQENSKSPVRKHLLVAGNSAAFLRCSVLARGREERAGFSWEGRARVLRAGAGRRWGVQWAADSWSTEAGIFLAPLHSFAIRLCCGLPVVVCSQHRAGSTRACCFPSALLRTKSSACILQRGVTTPFWGCFMHLFPERACSPSLARCAQSGCWKGQVPEEHKRFCLTA